MTPVIRKLALSAAAVVAVIGAIYLLPSAVQRDASQHDQADQSQGDVAPIPAAFPSATASSDPVKVPGLEPRTSSVTRMSRSLPTPPSRTLAAQRLTTVMPIFPTVLGTTRTSTPQPATPGPATPALDTTPDPTSRTTITSAATASRTSTVPDVATPTITTTSRPTAPPPAATIVTTTISPTAGPTPGPTVAPRTTRATPAPSPKPAPRPVPKPTTRPTPVPKPAPAPKPKPAPKPRPAPAPNFGIPVTIGNATQIITVRASSQYSTTGTLTAWQKLAGGGWSRKFGPVTAHLGTDGVGAPSEYNSHTPKGTWTISQAFGRDSDPGTSLPYTHVDGDDWWVSDVHSPDYNTLQVCARQDCPFDTGAGENLYNAGSVYDYAVVMDVNRWPATPGGGSAYFLHVTDGRSTAGCVSIDIGTLVDIMRWLEPAGHPRIAVNIG